MNKLTRVKGITLIALVITIIVLLILAGITISLTLGENGLLKRGENAVDEWKKAENKEKEELDIGDEIDKILGNSNNDKHTFEDNGIDKSKDGVKHDEVITKDGMWTIYKDIDTDTRKVYIYVESKYYCPSFEQFVFEKYYLNSILYSYALPVYSFADLADYFFEFNCVGWGYNEISSESDFFQLLGVDKYDFYKAMGKVLVEQLKKKETLHVKSGKIEINGQEIEQNVIFDISDLNNLKYVKYGSELTYENLLATYNDLYGDKINLTIPKEEESKTYKIELPNGKIEEINGKDLYKAKFRYGTTKNGDVQIKIENDSTQAETINYTAVTNIKECIYEEGEYVYTYNCLPYLDMMSMPETNADSNHAYRIDKILECRFNLDGWNVVGKRLYANRRDEETFQYNTQVKSSINGEPVTSMIATYESQFETVMMDTLNIPNTVKYMFDVCRHSKYNNITQILLPSSVEYTSYCFDKGEITIEGGENVKSWGLNRWNEKHNMKLE